MSGWVISRNPDLEAVLIVVGREPRMVRGYSCVKNVLVERSDDLLLA